MLPEVQHQQHLAIEVLDGVSKPMENSHLWKDYEFDPFSPGPHGHVNIIPEYGESLIKQSSIPRQKVECISVEEQKGSARLLNDAGARESCMRILVVVSDEWEETRRIPPERRVLKKNPCETGEPSVY